MTDSGEWLRLLLVTAAVAITATALLLLTIIHATDHSGPGYWPTVGDAVEVHPTLVPVVQADGRTALCCVDHAEIGVVP